MKSGASSQMHSQHSLRNWLELPLHRKGFLFWVASPLLFFVSLCWALVAASRRARGYAPTHPDDPFVVCIGNVIVGGAGKSPLVRAFARHFAAHGKTVAILARGMGSVGHVFADATSAEDVLAQLSDENREHLELLKAEGAGVVIVQGASRAQSLEAFKNYLRAKKIPGSSAICFLDDGLQHFGCPRHVNICIWDAALLAQSPFAAIPVGPWREGFFAGRKKLLHTFDYNVWTHAPPQEMTAKDLVMTGTVRLKGDVEKFRTIATITLITGFAKPERLLHRLQKDWNFQTIDHLALPDHAPLDAAVLEKINASTALIFSGKDWYRWVSDSRFVQALQGRQVLIATVESTLITGSGRPFDWDHILMEQQK